MSQTNSFGSSRLLDPVLNNINKMSEYIQAGRVEVQDVGIDLLENKVENPNISGLQDCIVDLVRAEQRVKAFTKSVADLKTQWSNGDLDDSVDVVEMLENSLKAEEEKSLDDRNVWEHEFMVAFVNQMKSIDQSVTLKTNGTTSTSNAEEDIEITQSEIATKCPITQSEIVDPVKDKTCNHNFEKDAILAHIKQSIKKRRVPKCPYPGCKNVLNSSNLEENLMLKAFIKRRARNAAK